MDDVPIKWIQWEEAAVDCPRCGEEIVVTVMEDGLCDQCGKEFYLTWDVRVTVLAPGEHIYEVEMEE